MSRQVAMSLVDKLVAKKMGSTPEEVAPPKEAAPKEPALPKKASLVDRLIEASLRREAILLRLGEAKFHSLEEGNKAVTKIFESMAGANEDLKETAKYLEEKNMDLMGAKLLDMSRSLDEALQFFQAKFPHLITF